MAFFSKGYRLGCCFLGSCWMFLFLLPSISNVNLVDAAAPAPAPAPAECNDVGIDFDVNLINDEADYVTLEGIWIVNLLGYPNRLTQTKIEDLQVSLQAAYSCGNEQDNGGFLELLDVFIDWEEEQQQEEFSDDPTWNNATATVGNHSSDTNSTHGNGNQNDNYTNSTYLQEEESTKPNPDVLKEMSFRVLVKGTSNLPSIFEDSFFAPAAAAPATAAAAAADGESNNRRMSKYETKENFANTHGLHRKLQGNADECICKLPTKNEYLNKLRLNWMPILQGYNDTTVVFQNAMDIIPAESKPCTVPTTTFGSSVGVQVVGNVDLVSGNELDWLADTFLSTYNRLNGKVNCDLSFRSLTGSRAYLDPRSVQYGQGEAAAGGGAQAGGMDSERRFLQTDADTITNTNVNVNGTNQPSLSPSHSATPSTSNIPTLTLSLMPSQSPTEAPTTRGPDLFTILLQLEGTCKGCNSDAALFDQTARRHHRQLTLDSDSDTHTKSLQNLYQDSCLCPIGTEEVSLNVMDFLEAWEEQIQQDDIDASGNSTGLDPDNNGNEGNNNTMSFNLEFYDNFTVIEQVQIYDCQVEQDEFYTAAVAEFFGDLSILTEEEVALVEQSFLESFNTLSEETCDEFQRQVTKVKTVARGVKSEMPSLAPSEMASDMPSTAPSITMQPNMDETGRRAVMQEQKEKSVNHAKRLLQTISPAPNGTSTPSTSLSPSFFPTESPTTRGADLFFLEFEITGSCNQCSGDIKLFDALTTRRLSSDNSEMENSPFRNFRGLRFLQMGKESDIPNEDLLSAGEAKCACPIALEAGGVNPEDFLIEFGTAIEENPELKVISKVESTEEDIQDETDSPTSTPSISTSPSIQSSTAPSRSASFSSSGSPSTMPTLIPTARPSTFPTTQPEPTNAPFSGQTTAPSALMSSPPSIVVSMNPTLAPSTSPTLEPTQAPTLTPTNLPSTSPSRQKSSVPTDTSSEFPSAFPSMYPSVSPSTRPTVDPTLSPTTYFPSMYPTMSPSTSPTTSPTTYFPSMYPTMSPTSCRVFTTSDELKTAVTEFCNNEDNAVMVYGNIDCWDVSQITDMNELFKDMSSCNPNIGSWDVSSVTDFGSMFRSATSFNQDISGWDTSSGTAFNQMFEDASSFDQYIGDWDVSNSLSFRAMFTRAGEFDQDIGTWVVSKARNFGGMFNGATKFDQDIGGWAVSSGAVFDNMFKDATAFDQDIGGWDVSTGTSFGAMFDNAQSFNQEIGQWNVGSSTTFNAMFQNAKRFNQDISGWDVSSGVAFNTMFRSASSFNQPLAGWDVSSGESFDEMFYNAEAFNQPIGDWNVEAGTSFFRMFQEADAFNQDLSDWEISCTNCGCASIRPALPSSLLPICPITIV